MPPRVRYVNPFRRKRAPGGYDAARRKFQAVDHMPFTNGAILHAIS
jgi:hypothetical protein